MAKQLRFSDWDEKAVEWTVEGHNAAQREVWRIKDAKKDLNDEYKAAVETLDGFSRQLMEITEEREKEDVPEDQDPLRSMGYTPGEESD